MGWKRRTGRSYSNVSSIFSISSGSTSSSQASTVVQGIRARLAALRKKMQIIAKRNSVPNTTPPRSESPVVAATATTPAISTTPPQ